MAEHDAQLVRARGCLMGQIAGDSLGSLVEFKDEAEIAADYPDGVRELVNGGTWHTLAGQPTDDSELALALARSLAARGTFDDEDVARAYAAWYRSNPFDCGNTVRAALSEAVEALDVAQPAAEAARDAASRTSQANGALMRVSPLGIFAAAATPYDILAGWAMADAALTHPHRACQDANAVYCVAIAYAIREGAAPHDVYAFARRWAADEDVDRDVRDWLAVAEVKTPQDICDQMGWARIAFQNAFHRLLHAKSLEQGVIDTVMRGGDTDTNAAIAGALLGAAQGLSAVPARWRQAVLNCRPERGREGVIRPRPPEYWPVDAIHLADRLLDVGRNAVRARGEKEL